MLKNPKQYQENSKKIGIPVGISCVLIVNKLINKLFSV